MSEAPGGEGGGGEATKEQGEERGLSGKGNKGTLEGGGTRMGMDDE